MSAARPSAPAGRTRLEPEARRRQILEAAVAAFGARPFEEVSMAEVARRAGVSKGLVFNYFGGKDELFVEVLRLAAERAKLVSDPDRRLPAGDRFRIALDRFVTLVEGSPHLLPAYEPSRDAGARAVIDALYEDVATRMIERMGVEPTARLEHAVLAWLEFVRTTTMTWTSGGRVTREQLVELQIATFRAAAQTALGPAARAAAIP